MKKILFISFFASSTFFQSPLFSYDIKHLEKVFRGDNNLQNLNLLGAPLQGLDLSGKDLSGSNLSQAILFKTNLSNATLINTNLNNAYAILTNFSGANLTNANSNFLTCAYALFIKTIGITREHEESLKQFGAIFDEQKSNEYKIFFKEYSEKSYLRKKTFFSRLCCCSRNSKNHKND